MIIFPIPLISVEVSHLIHFRIIISNKFIENKVTN